ncbi:MAG TPA: helix-turn-helix transcriptional regulator [Ramlibacter sp.]|nr:helix-turn-helix transcriptional regulator [Ramlibacter sp.]
MRTSNRRPITEECLNLVGQIYACAAEPEKTPDTLHLFAESVGGTSAQTFSWQRSSGKVVHSQFSETDAVFEEASRHYISYWGARDPRAAVLPSLPPGEVLRCHESFDEKFVADSGFYQDYFVPLGLRWSIAGMFDSGADTSTVIAALRPADMPPFDESAAAAVRQLLPHFQKASLIRARLEQSAPASKSAVEMLKLLPIPCLFTDRAGRCIERNEAFSQLVEQLEVRLVVGRVRFSDPNLQTTWETALSQSHVTALGQTILIPAPNGRHWKVHLVPLHSVVHGGDAFDKKMIMAVFDENAAEVQPTAQSLASGAGLTRAELEVLAGLLQGLPAKTIATSRGASVNTVRSQIMTILDKTGHKSQRELIASFGASSFGSSSFGASSSGASSSFGESAFQPSSFRASSFRHSSFEHSR